MIKLQQFIEPILEPIAAWFRGLGIPEPITHWGHPVMMAIVVLVMGSFVGIAGWRGRVATNIEVGNQQLEAHQKLAPWLFLFIALGYTGGVLSLVMQHKPILESGHFFTGSAVIILLTINGLMALKKFAGKPSLRTVHAYLGTIALFVLLIHAGLGLKLGLSI